MYVCMYVLQECNYCKHISSGRGIACMCNVLGSVRKHYDGVACRELVANRVATCAVTEK